MSTPKRHHFVPQFYLKRFSSGKRFIRCFHKATKAVIPRASIKGQCAIDNFYGWQDNIEWSLGVIESRAATMFRQIDIRHTLPDINGTDWQTLLVFMALQSSRTQLSGRESDDMADYYYKLMGKYEAEKAGIDLSKFRIGSQFPAALPMEIAVQAYPELNKLDRCLLINNSRMPFVTSDNPVVYYNSRYSQVDHMGTIGLSSEGLQIFYPISPTAIILLYDPESYKRPSNNHIKVLREKDVIQINLVHYLWSGEVLFWSNEATDAGVRLISEHCDPFLPYERSVNRESDHVDLEDGTKGSLVHSYRAHPPIEADFKFIRANGNSIPTGNLIRGSPKMPMEGPSRQYTFSSKFEPRRQMHPNQIAVAVRSIVKALDETA